MSAAAAGATLEEFARVSDAVAATTKKLQKYALLAEYLRGLADDADLRRAVRYLGGRAFAATDERVLNVGGALVSDVALSLVAVDPHAYHDACVRHGEIGEGLASLWHLRGAGAVNAPSGEGRDAGGEGADDGMLRLAPATPAAAPSPTGSTGDTAPLLLGDLAAAFELLAATGQWAAKRRVLLGLYARCGGPREAAYLTKVILGDMRTGVQAGVLQAAIARAFGRDEPQVQRCQLLVGDLGDVAVLARHDECGSAAFRPFHPLQFMLATPQETAADAAGTMDGRAFFAEDKLDGIRAQVHKAGEGLGARVAIYTRTLDRTDASFPDVVDAVRKLPGEFVLDGEIVPWRDGCVLPFAHVQKRLGRKVLTAAVLRENPAAFVAFDVLYRDGRLLMDEPLRARRAALEALARGEAAGAGARSGVASDGNGRPSGDVDQRCGGVEWSEQVGGDGRATDGGRRTAGSSAPLLLTTTLTEVTTADAIAAAFDAARGRRNEGIVLKDPSSAYSPGRRGQAWLKLKTHLPTFDCVVTAAETGHGKRRNSLSDYTFAVWDRDPAEDGARLVNVGKAFSGVSDEEIAQLTELFTKLTVAQFGRVRQVEPRVVLEIACDQIQQSARHASGYALRFPRIKRVRWDKRPEDADRLARIAEIYESTPNFARGTEGAAEAPASSVPAAPVERGLFDL